MIDLVASFPSQYIDCFQNVETPGLKIMKLMRLLKLGRLHRIHHLVDTLHKYFPDSIYLTTSAELSIYFFLLAHWSACAFFGVSYGVADPTAEEGSYKKYLFDNGWVAAKLFEDGSNTPIEFTNAWLTSLYWSVTTMSTIGKMSDRV